MFFQETAVESILLGNNFFHSSHTVPFTSFIVQLVSVCSLSSLFSCPLILSHHLISLSPLISGRKVSSLSFPQFSPMDCIKLLSFQAVSWAKSTHLLDFWTSGLHPHRRCVPGAANEPPRGHPARVVDPPTTAIGRSHAEHGMATPTATGARTRGICTWGVCSAPATSTQWTWWTWTRIFSVSHQCGALLDAICETLCHHVMFATKVAVSFSGVPPPPRPHPKIRPTQKRAAPSRHSAQGIF